MSIGFGILLIVIGAILRFALNMELAWINLLLVGNILMGAGVVVFILGLVFTFRRRRSTSTQSTVVNPPESGSAVRRTDRTDETQL